MPYVSIIPEANRLVEHLVDRYHGYKNPNFFDTVTQHFTQYFANKKRQKSKKKKIRPQQQRTHARGVQPLQRARDGRAVRKPRRDRRTHRAQ